MSDSLRQFNLKRNHSIVQHRIKTILCYVIDNYKLLVADGTKYDLLKIKETSTYKVEDYLSNELVDKYLKMNLHLINNSQLSKIIITKQSEEQYVDVINKKNRPDKIDIYITNLNINRFLEDNPVQPYFAIECKRIRKQSCIKEYVSDIRKFCNREYKFTRLPFEGQIAFIENPEYDPAYVSTEINKELLSRNDITTKKFLEKELFHCEFNESYHSIHVKNFVPNNSFSIYHLLFNYQTLLV
ncbi:MAG: hypothetical protein H6Q17_704 [Bacteroidetes bacterium]|nr:hypothetical protein [Bacteroidota bacterium]